MDTDSKPKVAFWLLIILVLIAFAGAVMYFSRGNPVLSQSALVTIQPTNVRQPRVYTVYYGLGVFSPTNIRVHVGDSIRFQNDSDRQIKIQSDYTNGIPDLVGFDSVGDIQPQGAFTYTFNKAGIFGYNNTKNPSEEGTVIVRP